MLLYEYPIAQYLLVLEPSEALKQDILQVKQRFAQQYEHAGALRAQPHISLLSCEQYVMSEPRWLPMLKRLVQETRPFQVVLDGFGSFPTHTIYLQVQTKTAIVELVKSLRPLQSHITPNKERKPHFMTEPHLPIARKLLPWQYEQGWLEMQHTHFHGSFMASQVLLLRKLEGEAKYSTLLRMRMEGVQQGVQQHSLFV